MKKEQHKNPRGVLRELFHYMRGCWGQTIGAWVSVIIEALCEVTIPFLMQPMIDVINSPDWPSTNTTSRIASALSGYSQIDAIWILASIMAAVAIVSALGGIFGGFFASEASARFGRNLRQAMYYKIQGFSFENIDHFSVSSLVTRLTTDVTDVQFALQMILRMIVRAPLMIVMAFVLATITCWKLSWVFLIAIPVLGTVLVVIALVTHPTFVKVFNAYDDLNESVKENLEGIRVVKSFHREDFEKEKFGKLSYFIYANFAKAESVLAWNSPVFSIVMNGTMLLISWLGALLVTQVNSTFTVGQLSSFFTYAAQILNALMFLSMGFVMVIISRNGAERITEVLQEDPSQKDPVNPVGEVPDGSVSFRHVSFKYFKEGEKDVLHDINIDIPSGSSLGIIGVTGSAKSTLVSLIDRLYDVSSGELLVGGHNVQDYRIHDLREAVGMVLQKNALFTGTIRSNLKWGNENATDEELWRACDIAQASEFVHSFPQGLDSPIDEGGTNVSGGQKQRLCIARALVKRPKILILDDSTSAVDTHTDSLIRQGFLHDLPGMTRIIVAQRLLSIKDCDQIIILEDGKILAKGTHEELLKNSKEYQELYETQLGGGGDFDE